jgi:DNA-binding PadR family transcriptional regulator
MRRPHRDHGFGAWAAFCGPDAGFGAKRHRGRVFDRGDLRYMILTLLAGRPMHGYEVMQELAKKAGGCYTPSAGSVYPVLQLLQDQGYVTAEDRDGKKVYSITDEGRKFLSENRERVDDVFDRISGFAERYTGSEMRDLTRSFIRFAQVSFEEALRRVGDSDEVDRLKDILDRATREMEEAATGGRRRGGRGEDRPAGSGAADGGTN